jgi:large subunit ribosomal protein L10
MKKIGLLIKEISEKRIKESLQRCRGFFIVKYSGLSGPQMNTLRRSLKDAKASMFVVKNSVARRALTGQNKEILLKSIEEPCGLVFVNEEPVTTSKALYNFSRENEALRVELGLIEDRILHQQDIEALARLASIEVLRAQLVAALNSPINGFVIVLNQILAKFVYCLDQIREKKEKGG